jgi:uncharacterized protein YjbJ (UPF0337 family)
MSTTMSDSTVKGKVNVAVGKVKQGVGEAVGSNKMANEGTAQQLKGHAQQTLGAVKEAVADHKADRDKSAHDVREKMTSTAQNVKEHIQHAIDPEHHPKP